MRERFDAIVIGAGPAGGTAAILLAQAGWAVALVERQAFPRRKVCGECIAASNLPLLHELGIGAAAMQAAGPELRTMALMHGAARTLAPLPPAPLPGMPWGRALGRETLDALLVEQAQRCGVTVLQPWSAVAIDGGAGNWRCRVRAADTRAQRLLHAPWAIAAHGSWEPLPAARDAHRVRRRASDLLAFKAQFRGAALAPGLLPVLCLDGGYGGMVLADNNLTTVACCVRRDRLDALRVAMPGCSAGACVEAWLQEQCRGVRDALAGASRVGPWLASGPLAPGVRLRAGDSLLRVGNAAGEVHPIIGEGISMALQSAALLTGHLVAQRAGAGAAPADASANAAVAGAYARDWRRRFGPRLWLAAAFAHAAMRPAGARQLMRAAQRWPALLTQGARWGGKTRCAVRPAAPPPAGAQERR